MIGGRKSRSNKGKKRTPYGPRSRTISGAKFRGSKLEKKVFSNNVSNATNNVPLIRAGNIVRPTFNTMNRAQRKRKVRSNKDKKRTPYGPRSRTRSGKKVKGGGAHDCTSCYSGVCKYLPPCEPGCFDNHGTFCYRNNSWCERNCGK